MNAVETGVLPFLEANDDVLAEDVAAEFGITPQTANNRLVALVRVGLVERERIDPKRGGKRFAYRVARAALSEAGLSPADQPETET